MTLSHRCREDGACEATLWLTVVYLPLLPLSRWKADYVGDAFTWWPHADPAFRFGRVERLPLDLLGVLKTYAFGLLAGIVAVAPAAAFVLWLRGPVGALRVAFMLLCGAWPAALIIGRVQWQKRLLSAFLQSRHDA